MGFGTNTNVNILRAPNVEGITSGLQNAILNAQQQSRLEQQDSDKALADLGALSKTRTIRDTLGNINKEGGVQSGLEVQDAASQRYNDLTTKYQDMLDQHDELSKQAKANGLITYDANGQETTDYTNPQLVALAENKKKLDSTYQKELEGLNTALSTRYKANPDMLNTVTNPADYEKRLADTLRTKGISDDVARATAKKEAAPYYAKDLTERQKAQIKDMSARRKLIIDNPANDQSITRGNGATKSGSSSKYNTKSSRANDAIALAKNWASISAKDKNWFSAGDNAQTVANTVSTAMAGDPNGLISKASWEAALNEVTKGEDNAILSLDRRIEGANELLDAAKRIEIANPNGGSNSYGGGSKGGTYSSVTTRNKGYSKNQLATVDKLNSSIDAILSGGRNKTVDEVLGKDFTTRTTKKDIVKAPVKGTTKAQSLFTGTDSLSKAMRTPKGDGALVKALLANPDGFRTTFSKMNPKQQASIGKVLSTPANVKLLDSLTSKPKAPVQPITKKDKSTLANNLSNTKVDTKSTYKYNDNYNKSVNAKRKWVHDLFTTDKTKSDSQVVRENASTLNKALKSFTPIKEITKTTKVPFSSATITEVTQESKGILQYMKELGLSDSQIKAIASNPKIDKSVKSRVAEALRKR